MELNLHANATTTPKVRAYIQRSKKSVAELAGELGVGETTIRRWRGRTTVGDRSHRPNRLTTNLSAMEETLVCELRTALQLPLDDIVEVMRRCVNGKLSRSAIHRCLQRRGISQRKKPDRPSVGVFEQATVGFIHFDLKHLPALERRKSYAFVAIDRATRYVYVEILPRRDAKTSAGFLKRFLAHFPHRVHTILTDNGAEFTDRFAVDMKNKPQGKPSGNHPFDLLCANHKIDHRLTRPYRPQTNGLVERFNRRITEAIGREPKRGSARRTFPCHADRDAFLNRFVADYNRTRLKCLGYLAPLEALANLPGPNTFAGTTKQLLRSLLRDRRLAAGDRGAAHVAGLRLVVAAHAVHGLAVVPHHEVVQRPFMDVDEFRLRGVLGEVAQQQPRFRHAHAPDRAGMR
jgi:transposase